MSRKTTRPYLFDRDEMGGPPTDLMRLVSDERGFYGESYEDGEWFENPYVVTYCQEPPFFGNYISEEEAMALIASGVLEGRGDPSLLPDSMK